MVSITGIKGRPSITSRWAYAGPRANHPGPLAPGHPTQANAIKAKARAKRRRKVRQVALSDWTNPANPTEPEADEDDEKDDLPDINVSGLKEPRQKVPYIEQA